MSTHLATVAPTATVQEAASVLALAGVGAVPVCGPDGELEGVLTDRDIVVRVVAVGRPPTEVVVREVTDDREVMTIGPEDSVDAAIETMCRHKVRRLPVLDGTELVGMLSQADIARSEPDERIAELLERLSS